jgi:DNA-binding MarR family transcriptional regulator
MPSRLQDEIQKKTAFASIEEELYLSILRTGDRLQIHAERLFRDFALTPSQYNILRILRSEAAPLPILEIAARTITAVPGITGLIDRLEKVGFVERKRCLEDRRVIFANITPTGLKTLADIDAPLQTLQAHLLNHLTHSEKLEAIRLLDLCRAALP